MIKTELPVLYMGILLWESASIALLGIEGSGKSTFSASLPALLSAKLGVPIAPRQGTLSGLLLHQATVWGLAGTFFYCLPIWKAVFKGRLLCIDYERDL